MIDQRHLLDGLLAASLAAADRPEARDDVRRSLLDFVACAGAEAGRLPAGAVGSVEAGLAFAACALDRDDVHWRALVHPGGVVWPTAIATGGTGPALERAAIAGYEVMVRLALALGPSHRRFWQPTATVGPAGAAVVASLLRGADESSTRDALAHAVSIAGGSAVALAEQAGTRWFHRVHAVEAGIAAARFAAAGIHGTARALEGPAGVLAALSASSVPGALEAPDSPAIVETSPRLAAVSGWALAAVAAAGDVGPLAADDIERVDVTAHPAAAAVDIREAVARTLLGGEAPVSNSGSVDPEVSELAERVFVNGAREDGAAEIVVDLRDGGRVNASSWPLGHPKRPVEPAELTAKWRALWATGSHRATWDDVEAQIDARWQADGAAPIMELLAPPHVSIDGGETP